MQHFVKKKLIPCNWYAACITGETKEGLWGCQAFGMIKAAFAYCAVTRKPLKTTYLDRFAPKQFTCTYFFIFCDIFKLLGLPAQMYSLLFSLYLHRYLRMIGVVSPRWERTTRSLVGECAVEATSRPWRRKTAATRTAVQNPRLRFRRGVPATWRPHSHL